MKHREYLIYDGNPSAEEDPLDSDESSSGDSDNTGNSSQAEDKKGVGTAK